MTFSYKSQYKPQLWAYNGYAPNHNGPLNQQPAGNGRQVPPHNPSPSNTHDVRFMEGNTEPQTIKPSTSEAMPMECQNQHWSPNTSAITYQLRGVYEGTICKEPVLAVTIRAIRNSAPAEDELDGQENHSSDDVE